MPPEWNTRSMVEVPDVFVCGLLHDSARPTRLGSAALSRATLSNSRRLSSGERPGPKFPLNGMTWACATADKRMQAASAAEKRHGNRGRIHLSSSCSASLGRAAYRGPTDAAAVRGPYGSATARGPTTGRPFVNPPARRLSGPLMHRPHEAAKRTRLWPALAILQPRRFDIIFGLVSRPLQTPGQRLGLGSLRRKR